MGKKDIQLLEESIIGWDCYASGVTTELDFIEEVSCPLCEEYASYGNKCKGCPVYEKTGQIICTGSPFGDWLRAVGGRVKMHWCVKYTFIEAKIEFLVSLLPETHEWRNV